MRITTSKQTQQPRGKHAAPLPSRYQRQGPSHEVLKHHRSPRTTAVAKRPLDTAKMMSSSLVWISASIGLRGTVVLVNTAPLFARCPEPCIELKRSSTVSTEQQEM